MACTRSSGRNAFQIARFRLRRQGEVGIRKPAFREADDFEMLLGRAELFALNREPDIGVLPQIPLRIDSILYGILFSK